ncbi:hypothetical protein, partial [Desulfosarcina cetonica]|uniref:hypothetical protein n=1 Tax=Desulfosarcina cetonica TaxID=90730 RepID=UPI001C450176
LIKINGKFRETIRERPSGKQYTNGLIVVPMHIEKISSGQNKGANKPLRSMQKCRQSWRTVLFCFAKK